MNYLKTAQTKTLFPNLYKEQFFSYPQRIKSFTLFRLYGKNDIQNKQKHFQK